MKREKNNIVLLGDCKMAKPKRERGKVISIDMAKEKCLECKVEYDATKTAYQNGDVVISPKRCVPCQTIHLTNLRVNKTIKDLSLLGNLKARLVQPGQRDAVITAITTAVEALMDRYSGSTVKASAFDLKKVKV